MPTRCGNTIDPDLWQIFTEVWAVENDWIENDDGTIDPGGEEEWGVFFDFFEAGFQYGEDINDV